MTLPHESLTSWQYLNIRYIITVNARFSHDQKIFFCHCAVSEKISLITLLNKKPLFCSLHTVTVGKR